MSLTPEALLQLDALLATIPDAAWGTWKAGILAQVDQHNPARGWAQALDLFNEARAYRHLAKIGCDDIAFCPRDYLFASPDLRAKHQQTPIRCEVKTLHLGRDASLTPALLRKLRSRLDDGLRQLRTDNESGRRLLYLVLAGSGDIAAISAWFTAAAPSDLEIVIDPLES
ncbi:hypothetical protein [Dongia sp.]|uniref:hypothetical protein n=1 Tax=Dongia sp. TaxID=1977262 RepID=UPI0035B00AD6